MKILRILVAFALVIVGVVSIVGSGGGGGGFGELDFDLFGPFPQCCEGQSADVDITTINAHEVSATVVRGIGQVFDVGVKIDGQVFPRPPSAPTLLPGSSKFGLLAQAANGDVTDTCVVSGTVSVAGLSTNDPVFLSPGDGFHFAFERCDDGNGYTISGSFWLYLRELDGDPRTDVFQLVYALTDMMLSVSTGSVTENIRATNSVVLRWDSRAYPEVVLTVLTATWQVSSSGEDYSWLHGDHLLTVNADVANPATQKETDNTLMESAVLGYISYAIVIPLQAPEGQEPESGEILISGGDGNGNIHIIIESATSVRLEIDVDGDGTIDDYQYTTWGALSG